MRAEDGLSMVEMLVTLAVLGIVMTMLASLYWNLTDTMRRNTARAEALETLTILSDDLYTDLANLAVNHDVMDTKPYRLVGIDGDGTFENSTHDQHPDFSETPNNLSDRLHLHVYYSNSQISNDLSGANPAAALRVYQSYWINGKGSDHVKSELQNRYGLLKRRRKLNRNDRSTKINGKYPVIPVLEDELTPLLDLNTSSSSHVGTEILGLDIDYFSLRYYDLENDTWRNCWDTANQLSSCSHPGDDEGALPSVIQFAVRAYDNQINQDPDTTEAMTPVWYQSSVSLKTLRQ